MVRNAPCVMWVKHAPGGRVGGSVLGEESCTVEVKEVQHAVYSGGLLVIHAAAQHLGTFCRAKRLLCGHSTSYMPRRSELGGEATGDCKGCQ